MNKIHFDQQSFKNNKIQVLFLLIVLFLLLLNLFEVFRNFDQKIVRWINLFGYSVLTVILLKRFWYKNYVRWNRRIIQISINEFWGKTIKFVEIGSFNIENHQLVISKINGEKTVINLQNIEPTSINQLLEILNDNK